MLLQTNSYIVPREKRAEHARLLARFRQILARLGCDHFEAYEQVGTNWSTAEPTGRFVQIMRFRDRKHQQEVQGAEATDAESQALVKEFCALINLPYQQQQGLFAMGYYNSVLAIAPTRVPSAGQVPPEPMPVPQPPDTSPTPEDHAARSEDEPHVAPNASLNPT